MTKLDAVILAGGRNSEAMQAATGVENRALVRLGGRTMLDHVIAALQSAQTVESIVVVGDVPEQQGCHMIVPGKTLVDNLFRGMSVSDQTRPVLAVTSDIPFLTAAAVDDFTARAAATGADFCYPIVPLTACQTQFPGMRRTTLKIKEGTFTGGNLMLLTPLACLEHRTTILRAYEARKRPLTLGRMLGWGLLARLALAQAISPAFVSVPLLEAGVSRLLDCRVAAVITEYAEIGTDVDRPEDIQIAQTLLAAQCV